jgi:gliding motility-associated-like protein
VICEGYKFGPLTASAVGGGNGTFYYKWQDSINLSINYLPAAGTNNTASYSVDTSTFSIIEKRYLRRVVFSGPDSVCRSNSLPILLTRYHKLKSNFIISADTTIGYDTVPHMIRARKMIGGDGGNGIYTYIWRSKTTSWDTAPLIFNQQNYSPDSLKITTLYRRVVNSSVCTDTSTFITVTVQSKILGNNIFLSPGIVEDSICYGLAPVLIKANPPSGGSTVPFDYSYKWYRSGSSAGPWTEIIGKTDSVFQPDTLHKTTYFRRYVSSPKVSPRSVDKSNIIKITVLALITNKDISPLTQAICSGSPINPINSSGTLAGGDNSYRFTWRQDSANTGWKNIPGYVKTLSATYSKSSIKDPFRYIRYVYSGSNDCCADSSNTVIISINPLPTGNITPATDRICEGSQVPLIINLTGKKPWNIKYTESASTGSSQVSPPSVTSAASTIYRIPPVITADSLAYSYSLFSVQDSNLCLATSLTVGLRKSTVYKYPKSNAGLAADSVCGHSYILKATKNIGIGIWTKTAGPGSITFAPNANTANAQVSVDSTSSPWLDRNVYSLKWKEVNWQCADSASAKIIFNKGTGSAHPGKSADLYSFGVYVDSLHAIKPLAGSGLWTSGDNVTIVNPSDPRSKVTGLIGSTQGVPYHFKWTVQNGACVSDSTIIITSYDLIFPKGFSPDNGDNYNNTFIIKGLNTDNKVNAVTLRIVNSAGSEVFYQTNAEGWKDWDGKNSSGKDLPDGSYYYLLTYKSAVYEDTIHKKSGFVVIKRTKN